MSPPGLSLLLVLLTLRVSAGDLKVSNDGVTCSQGLLQCTMKNETSFPEQTDAVDVKTLMSHFELCCRDQTSCSLCLVINLELNIHLDEDMEPEGSGPDEEEDGGDATNQTESVTVCYKPTHTLPTCMKVEFVVNRSTVTHHLPPKIFMVITKPAGVFFSSEISVFPSKSPKIHQQVVALSVDKVCRREDVRVDECRGRKHIPKLTTVINEERNEVELRLAGTNQTLPQVCIQNEQDGSCQMWNQMTIPLSFVTHCMCLQVWFEGSHWRSQSCPFTNKGASVNVSSKDVIQRNLRQKVSASVVKSPTMLLWNLSAPCRLEGEVWPCHEQNSCRKVKGFRQQLENGMWRQNSKGFWEYRGVFEEIRLGLSACVMVKVEGQGPELGPFCFNNTHRQHWSLLLVSAVLLVCLTVLCLYLLHTSVKRKLLVNRKAQVVLLSPPDMDDGVSESVCQLGSLLSDQGVCVSVDQWTRRVQCSVGPLPWLHSQLQELNGLGGRVLLVLTNAALVRAAKWSRQHGEVEVQGDPPQIWSPYCEVFTACLCLIEAEKKLGKPAGRFVLVKLDSHPSDGSLPEFLQGLPLFQLPSQTRALLSELEGAGRRSGGRRWMRWKQAAASAWRAKLKVGPGQKKATPCRYI